MTTTIMTCPLYTVYNCRVETSTKAEFLQLVQFEFC